MTTLHTLEAINAFFRDRRAPVTYINTSTFNLLGADCWIGGLEFINSVDSFAGQHSRVFIPTGAATHPPSSIEEANNYLLSHPEVQERLLTRGPGHALFLMFDDASEVAIQGLGWRVAFPPARLRRHLDSKLTTTRLGDRAGVPSVPNILTPISSYAELRRVAYALGPDLVVQLPYGDSGATTFFISSERDFVPHAGVIAAQPAVKVMQRIRCRQATIEGCVTCHGTLAGPLMTELIGTPELTPLHGGWCGNELVSAQAGIFAAEVRRQAVAAVQAMGAELRRAGYWGYFGLDLLLDIDTGALYLGELNPRITGATPMTSQAALDQGVPPLLLFHLLEALSTAYEVDVAAYNRRWQEIDTLSGWSQLIVEHTGAAVADVQGVPRTGIWRLGVDSVARYVRPSSNPQELTGEDEALVLSTVVPGQHVPPGYSLFRLLLRGRVMNDGYELNGRARSWVHALRAQVALQPTEAIESARNVPAGAPAELFV